MKKSLLIGFVLVSTSAVFVHGCAQKKIETALDDKLSRENVQTGQDLTGETSLAISGAEKFSETQKADLRALHADMDSKLENLRKQSLQLRAVLVKDVVDTDYNEDEISLIKERLASLDKERLDVVFQTIDKANSILGRDTKGDGYIVRKIIEPSGVGKFQP